MGCKKVIDIDVVQGIGDIFWVYQKFFRYCDVMNFTVLTTARCPIQRRAQAFLKLLPKVGSVSYKTVETSRYNDVCGSYKSIWDVLHRGDREYACNRPLEQGIRLDALDNDAEVSWDLPIFSLPREKPFKKYVLMYVSGSKPDFTWDIAAWSDLALGIRPDLPIILVGAKYDQDNLMPLHVDLALRGRRNEVIIGDHPAYLVDIIKNCELFIGYQSGLNVIADNFHKPQVMLYFPFLRSMMYTWCQPHHMDDRTFNPFTFESTPESILASLPEAFKR